MGAIADINSTKSAFGFYVDSVVIRNYLGGILGGKTLDMTDYPNDVLKAGHVVIRNTTDDTYKPMPLNEAGDAYGSLPDGCEYVGVTVASVPKDRPFVGIMHTGSVNDLACEFAIDGIKAAVKTALPTLVFEHD